jgi:hypothetical protein
MLQPYTYYQAPEVATMFLKWHLKGVSAMGIYVDKNYIPNKLDHAPKNKLNPM